MKFAVSIDKRIEGGSEVGAHKTSMLQDLERRRLEIDALAGAVVELADRLKPCRAASPHPLRLRQATGCRGSIVRDERARARYII